MILGHELPEIKKTVVSLIVTGAALAAFFIKFDPSLTPAVVAVAIAVIGVLEVYNRPHSFDDISKAVAAAVAAGVALYGFFHVYDPGESEKLIAIGAAILNVVGVFFARNESTS